MGAETNNKLEKPKTPAVDLTMTDIQFFEYLNLKLANRYLWSLLAFNDPKLGISGYVPTFMFWLCCDIFSSK